MSIQSAYEKIIEIKYIYIYTSLYGIQWLLFMVCCGEFGS